MPAPYRFPIWARIAESFDIKVAFLLGEKNWRNWNVPHGQTWRHEFLSLKSINLKEYDLIPSIRGVNELLRDVDVLILGGWESPFYIRAMSLAKRKNIRVIQFYESTKDTHRIKNGLIRRIRTAVISKADLIVTISTASTMAVEAMGIDSQKIITLFNPVDVCWFHSFTRDHRTPFSTSHHYIYVGQLIERKNAATIIRSFAAIRGNADTLTIAGDGPLLHILKNLATTLVGHRSQEELAKLYAASNTLILVSTSEVWGLVVNEALASGLHVVVSDKCGVAEFVHAMDGVFICGTDQKSLQEAMHASSIKWSGHLQNPEILKYTPEKFADQITSAISRL
jgi:glycosyltransferase involved in cell wall biosynthesis